MPAPLFLRSVLGINASRVLPITRLAPQECPRDIAEVKEQLQETESRLDKKLDQETRDRTEDIEDIRRDLGRIAGTDESAGGPSLVRIPTEGAVGNLVGTRTSLENTKEGDERTWEEVTQMRNDDGQVGR